MSKHTPSEIEATPAKKEALEAFYTDWWAENFHIQEMGLPGDLVSLREGLNAAWAKASNSDC